MRGISMLPSGFRAPKSNSPSKNRWVVSSWVSITIEEKCSCFARSVILSALVAASIAPASTIPARRPIPTLRRPLHTARSLIFLSGGLHLAADTLSLLHHMQQIPAKNLANVVVTIAFAHESFCNPRQVRAIIHTFGHVRAVKVGTQTHMICPDQLHGM